MLLDTSCWIEYFKGTGKGEKLKERMENQEVFYTCPITIAEISVWCHKNNKLPKDFITSIKKLSVMMDMSEDILAESGRIYHEERKRNGKIGLIDCMIYATAQMHELVLLTKDTDFKNLKDVKIL
ncbi:MAG: PIN domain-containing protein [Candidatus Aenigmatarchaeota archaeon]